MEDAKQFVTLETEYDRSFFVMMRYGTGPYFSEIADAVRSTLDSHKLIAHMASDAFRRELLWDNVRNYMSLCR